MVAAWSGKGNRAIVASMAVGSAMTTVVGSATDLTGVSVLQYCKLLSAEHCSSPRRVTPSPTHCSNMLLENARKAYDSRLKHQVPTSVACLFTAGLLCGLDDLHTSHGHAVLPAVWHTHVLLHLPLDILALLEDLPRGRPRLRISVALCSDLP